MTASTTVPDPVPTPLPTPLPTPGPTPLAPITGVTGGIAGLEAQYAAVAQLAEAYDAAGDQARSWAALGPQVAAHGDLLASAPLSPVSFAGAEAAVLRATTGPDGALGRSLAWEAEAVAVRAALGAIIAADELAHEAVEARDYALGLALGRALGSVGLLTAGMVAGSPAALAALALTARLGPPPGVSTAAQQVLIDHPGVAEALFNGGGGVVDGLLGPPLLHPDTAAGADAVAGLYDDGSAGVRRLDRLDLVDVDADGDLRQRNPPAVDGAPRDLADLLGRLSTVAGLSVGAGSLLNGTIAVATLRSPGGPTRHVVYLPGTDDMLTTPRTQDGDVRDMATNLDLVAGRHTAYEEGVLEAMRQAGVHPGEPVLLVGHSQGGMVAAALAADDTPYDIRHVVTAGSPTAQVQLPDDVQVLSLENSGDVVPLTDGEPNRPSTSHVTVTVDAGGAGLVGRHGWPAYVAGAAAADASSDPSVVDALRSLRADGFLGAGPGVHVDAQVYQVTRR